MKTYTIIAGVNGVGKSSFTGVKKESIDLGTIIDVDQITHDLGQGQLMGGKEALKQIDSCIANGISFTQETTLSGRGVEARVKQAKELGYHIRMFYIGLNTAEDSIIRIQNRVMKGKHGIPTEDVLRRFEKRWESLVKVLPYCDEADFYDNDNGFMKVALYRDRMFQVVGNSVPQWLSELTSYFQKQNHPDIQVRFPSFKTKILNAEQRAGTVQTKTQAKEHKR